MDKKAIETIEKNILYGNEVQFYGDRGRIKVCLSSKKTKCI